jgi:hypothetical protein
MPLTVNKLWKREVNVVADSFNVITCGRKMRCVLCVGYFREPANFPKAGLNAGSLEIRNIPTWTFCGISPPRFDTTSAFFFREVKVSTVSLATDCPC